MQLFSALTLADRRYPHDGGYPGFLIAPPVDEVAKIISSSLHILAADILDCKFVVNFNYGYQNAVVSLVIVIKDNRFKEGRVISLASTTIEAVNNNCGAIHLSGFTTVLQRKGLGSILMTQLLKWFYEVGYTMICCNTAGTTQNTYALPFFKKHGFIQMGKSYVNARSENINVWLQKFVRNGDPTNWIDTDQDDDWNDEDFDE